MDEASYRTHFLGESPISNASCPVLCCSLITPQEWLQQHHGDLCSGRKAILCRQARKDSPTLAPSSYLPTPRFLTLPPLKFPLESGREEFMRGSAENVLLTWKKLFLLAHIPHPPGTLLYKAGFSGCQQQKLTLKRPYRNNMGKLREFTESDMIGPRKKRN